MNILGLKCSASSAQLAPLLHRRQAKTEAWQGCAAPMRYASSLSCRASDSGARAWCCYAVSDASTSSHPATSGSLVASSALRESQPGPRSIAYCGASEPSEALVLLLAGRIAAGPRPHSPGAPAFDVEQELETCPELYRFIPVCERRSDDKQAHYRCWRARS